MAKIVIDYDRNNLDDFTLTLPEFISSSEVIIVLAHAIGEVSNRRELEEDLINLTYDNIFKKGE